MNAQKFTQKSLEAIQEAQNLAIEHQNMQIELPHLTYTLLTQEGGLIPQLMVKIGVDADILANGVMDIIRKMPRVSGSGREQGKVYVSQQIDQLLTGENSTQSRS